MNLSGNPFDYLIAFLGGILASFTPCVYPLVPVIVGYIGVKSQGERFKGFFLSLIFVTGIAITYSTLGLVASLTGTIFGKISSHPITYISVGIVIILFGVSMFGLIKLPTLTVRPAKQKEGYLGVFLLGLTSGFLVSPCLTPVMGSILLYLSTKQSVLYGTTLLMSFAYGMGLIFVLAGTFSALLLNLPKPGKWTVYLKKLMALILIATGTYFLYMGIKGL
ncbi:MAG: sulfite exporter TauE/SafE family protein [Candidatus Omnitrophica bacterium]|nr:sulfite exporter TauE/SafE family protein [Candidatus Omnitrophota bacterium]